MTGSELSTGSSGRSRPPKVQEPVTARLMERLTSSFEAAPSPRR